MNNDELYNLLFQSHADDIKTIRHFISWIKARRLIHNTFYFRAHWVKPTRKEMHWIGRL